MSDVIDFLEKLGQDSTLRHATGAQLQGALSDLDPQLRAALIAGDRQAIEALLGADNNVCCIVNAPLQEEEEAAPERREEKVAPRALGNVCCLINAPLQEDEEAPPVKRDKQVAPRAASNVCCMIFAPLQEEEEADGQLRRSA